MKYSSLLGIIFLAIGCGLFFIFSPQLERSNDLITGGFLGSGVGFLMGGFLGYFMKKTTKVVTETVAEVKKTAESSIDSLTK